MGTGLGWALMKNRPLQLFSSAPPQKKTPQQTAYFTAFFQSLNCVPPASTCCPKAAPNPVTVGSPGPEGPSTPAGPRSRGTAANGGLSGRGWRDPAQ